LQPLFQAGKELHHPLQGPRHRDALAFLLETARFSRTVRFGKDPPSLRHEATPLREIASGESLPIVSPKQADLA